MRKLRIRERKDSGQLLIVAALAIAVLISSTTTYVYELSEANLGTHPTVINDFVFSIKQATRNSMISSLANVSNGGSRGVLSENLDSLSRVLRSTHQSGITNLKFTAFNTSDYIEGTRLLWNATDMGVSTGFSNFTLQVYGDTSIDMKYAINVTSAITVTASYTTLAGGEKNVDLIFNVTNEGEPALAKNITLFYNDNGNWTQVTLSNNLSIIDYQNGTYAVFFSVMVSDPALISVHILDFRGIFVDAETTCFPK
jgi:hypothetical protein